MGETAEICRAGSRKKMSSQDLNPCRMGHMGSIPEALTTEPQLLTDKHPNNV